MPVEMQYSGNENAPSTQAKKKSGGKSQPKPLDVILPDGTKVTFPAPPKKPLSPYMAFQMQRRQALLAAEPNLAFTEIGSKLGECWQRLTPEEKEVYTKKYREEYDIYKETRKAYEQKVAEIKRRYGISDAQMNAKPTPSNLPSSPKSPFQIFREKMARHFATMNISSGDFEKIVLNMWQGFTPQEKSLYISLAEKLYRQSQTQASYSAPTSSPSRMSWSAANVGSMGYPPGGPMSKVSSAQNTIMSPSIGNERHNPGLSASNTQNQQRILNIPTSPFAVFQEQALATSQRQSQATQERTIETEAEHRSPGGASYHGSPGGASYHGSPGGASYHGSPGTSHYHGTKRPHSENAMPSATLDSLIICPGDHLTEDQKKSLKKMKTASFDFEVGDHLGNCVGQVLEFTWKQEPMNTYLTHHGMYEEAQIPDSVCTFREEGPEEMDDLELETELPAECDQQTGNEKDSQKTSEMQNEGSAAKSEENASGNKSPSHPDDSGEVQSSNSVLLNILNKEVRTFIDLDSDNSDQELESTIESENDNGKLQTQNIYASQGIDSNDDCLITDIQSNATD